MATAANKLGRLEKVDLKDVWKHEAHDFTPWLASEENIALLGDTIGIDLEVEAQEKNVGPFRADILCKDTANDLWVLIENQLERTDHSHLGQLLTYAAGLSAVTIVWIARRFTEEHRAALDWLNEMTGEEIMFFGLEVELWQIGESPIAPKFNVVSSPNDWTKRVAQGARNVQSAAVTPAKEMQVEFWTAFREQVETRGANFKPTKPLPQHWMNIAIGRSGVKLSAIASQYDSQSGSFDKNEIRVELDLHDDNAKSFFAQLELMKEQIEQELGEPLIWYNPENKKSCRIYVRTSADLDDRVQWPTYHEWLRTKLDAFQRVFRKRVKELDADAVIAEVECGDA